MKDPQNITIALLLVTAAALGAILVSSYQSQDSAAYAGAAIKGGDYVLGQGNISASADLIYVLDIGSRRLNVYYTNINTNTIDIVDSVDLGRAFEQ